MHTSQVNGSLEAIEEMNSTADSREKIRWEASLHWLILCAVILMGVALRFHQLEEDSLWIDEILTAVRFVEEPIPHIVTHFHPNNHTFFSLLAHLFTLGEGRSDFMLRMPATILGILAIPAIYRLGRLVVAPTTGLVAAFLLAVSPYHIRFSQDARGYTGMVLFSLLSIFFLFQAIRSGRRHYMVGFVVTTALAIYTHLFTMVLVGAEACVLGAHLVVKALRERRRGRIDCLALRRWAIALLVLALLLVVLFSPLWWALASVADESDAALYVGGGSFETDWAPDIASLRALLGRFGGSWNSHGRIVASLLLGFFGLGLAASFVQRSKWALSLISLLLLSYSAIMLAINVTDSVYVYRRFLVFMMPIYLLLASYGLVAAGTLVGDFQWFWLRVYPQTEETSACRPREVRRGAVPPRWLTERYYVVYVCISLTFLAFGMLEVASLKHYYAYERQDWKGAAQILNAHVSSGDAVVSWREFCLAYYYPGDLQSIPWNDEGEALRVIRSVYAAHDRMWFVYPAGLPGRVDRAGSIRQWLEQEDFLLTRLPGIWVWFRRRSGLPLDERQAEMMSLVEDVVRMNADNAPVLGFLGNAYLEQNLPDFAIEAFDQAVRAEPKQDWYRARLTAAMIAKEALVEPISQSGQPSGLEPDFGEPWQFVRHGDRLSRSGDMEQAIAAYEKALALDSNLVGVWQKLGDILFDQGQFERAAGAFRKAAQLAPYKARLFFRLCRSYRRLGGGFEAEMLAACWQAVVLDPSDAWYRVLLGDAYARNQLGGEALAEYGVATSLEPAYQDEAWYHVRLGDAYRLLGELEQARGAYRQSLDIDPHYQQAQERLSELQP
jgi:tetratricopeptide (TPR) repeat protein